MDIELNESEINVLKECFRYNLLVGQSYLGRDVHIPVKQSLVDRGFIHQLKTMRYVLTDLGAQFLEGYYSKLIDFDNASMVNWYHETQYENMKQALIKSGDW